MLKETETEETTVFFCDIFIIGNISIEGVGGGRARFLWLRLCQDRLCVNSDADETLA